ncbi:MAG: site-2 protease family protein [Patescibacteria group bacterium]
MIILLVLIGLSLLIIVHELGHFLTAKLFGVKVDEFGFGFPPKLFGKQFGETKYTFNLLPLGGFVKIHGENGEEQTINDKRSFSYQPIWKKSLIVLAGISTNIILGFLILSAVFMIGAPEHLMISAIAPDSPAQTAGLETGDIISGIKYENTALYDPVKSDEFVNLVKASQGGMLTLEILRNGELVNISLKGRINPPAGQGSIGIALGEIGFKPASLTEAVGRGFKDTILNLKLITLGLIGFASKLFVTPNVLDTVTGPVGIFTLASQTGELGIVYLLQFMAFISLNLAILNLMPIPALDGGRFLFLILEKIIGSRFSRKTQLVMNAVGFTALIALMIIVTIKDVGRLIQ